MTQGTLFDPQIKPRFDGESYDQQRDGERLASQLERVRAAMSNGHYWTLRELVERCGGTEASISARLRDLRKPRFGGHTIERVHVERGLFAYRMVLK